VASTFKLVYPQFN